jgi:hypothetical protein
VIIEAIIRAVYRLISEGVLTVDPVTMQYQAEDVISKFQTASHS